MAKGLTKPLLSSKQGWLNQLLLERLRRLEHAHLNDAALKHLAQNAARRLAHGRLGYGEVDVILASAPQVIASLATVDRDSASARTKPIGAAELKRLKKAGKLPRLPPWL